MKKTPFRAHTHNVILRKLSSWVPLDKRNSKADIRVGYYPNHAIFLKMDDMSINVILKPNMDIGLTIKRRAHFGQPYDIVYDECIYRGSDISAKDFDEPRTKATAIATEIMSHVKRFS